MKAFLRILFLFCLPGLSGDHGQQGDAKHAKQPVAWQRGLIITCEYTPPDEKKESLLGVTLYDSENTQTSVTYNLQTGNCLYSGEIKGICDKNSSVTMLTAVFTNQQPNQAKAFNCVAQFYKVVPWNESVGQTNVSPAGPSDEARRQNSDGSYAGGLIVGVLSAGIPLLIILACVLLYDRCERFKVFVQPAVVRLRCCFRKKDVSVSGNQTPPPLEEDTGSLDSLLGVGTKPRDSEERPPQAPTQASDNSACHEV